ncbi:unannotated protein [freshwater metagenome]|uniref:Unannotated protein n=1 Tax=freshwater metagenome TaxID=449393 RepID=A0A6J7UYB8_9ZZZZ
MRTLQVALHSFRAEFPLVERKLVPRLEANDFVVFDLEFDSALLPTEATVCLHHPVGHDPAVPSTWGLFIQMWPITRDEFLFRNRYA